MAEKDAEGNMASEQELAKEVSDLEPGDEIYVNGKEETYQVVSVKTYSVIAEKAGGHRVTISQNLQTGGWSITETVHRLSKI